MPNPTVSVLLPVGREDPFLPDALACLARQTFTDFHLHLLVSPGLERYVADQVAAVGGQFHYEVHTVRLRNFVFALNLGVELSCGELIARMDSDDYSTDNRLAVQVAHLQKNPRTCVVGLRTDRVDEKGRVLQGARFPYFETDREIRSALRIRNPICHSSIMIRRSHLEAVGGYRNGNSAEDHELYLRLARDPAVEFANLGEAVCYYRLHEGQGTRRYAFYPAFTDIAGFMYTELLRTKDPRYMLGMFRYHPVFRRAGAYINRARQWLARDSGKRMQPEKLSK